jgi:hypothetical protein
MAVYPLAGYWMTGVNSGTGVENLMKFDASSRLRVTGFLLMSSLARGRDSRAHGVWKPILERTGHEFLHSKPAPRMEFWRRSLMKSC